ncbi:unnamed protein product, partial [marine sediment metagenome]
IGVEFRNCSHMCASRVQVGPAGAETGLIGVKFYGAHAVQIREVDLECMDIGVQIDGADLGFGASQDCVVDGGYIQSASNTGKGIYVKANALRSNLLRLTIQGTAGATSIGIDDDVTVAGNGSRYRDCTVKMFDTLVDRIANNSSKFNNTTGYVTENSGTATLAKGATSTVVNHGLGVTPAAGDIMVTPIEAWGRMTQFYIGNYTSTQFTIYADQDPGQDVDFTWKAVAS